MLVFGFDIEIIKKRIKNIHLYVLPPSGKVRISAPLNTSDGSIYIFAASKIDWIKKQVSIFEGRPKIPDYDYSSGETHLLWGEKFTLEVKSDKGSSRVEKSNQNLIMHVRGVNTTEKRLKVLNDFYRAELKEKLPQYINSWQEIISVNANTVDVKNMRTRWGTCNVNDKKIWINLQLAKKPIYCLEYVVVHELVHLLEKNHGAGFRKKMDGLMPNWKSIRAELNNIVLKSKS